MIRYSVMSDIQLCDLAKRYDQKATEELLSRHDRWINKCAHRWSSHALDKDDFESIAKIAAIKSFRTYNPNRRVKISTYLWYCIRTACDHTVKFWDAQCRSQRMNSDISLDCLIESGVTFLDNGLSPEDVVIGNDERFRLVNRMLDGENGSKSVRNRLIIMMLSDGFGISDVSSAFGISLQLVNRIRERARTKIDTVVK